MTSIKNVAALEVWETERELEELADTGLNLELNVDHVSVVFKDHNTYCEGQKTFNIFFGTHFDRFVTWDVKNQLERIFFFHTSG